MSTTFNFEDPEVFYSLPMMPPKVCGCGKQHDVVPKKFKMNEDGLWFDCTCGSTLMRRNYQDWLLDHCEKKNAEVRARIDEMERNSK